MANSPRDDLGNSLKICIIGAGFSGMCTAIKLKKDLDLKTFTIYDENDEVGGTWFTHSYPGCGCDVPSHLYSFSFEPNPAWSTVYAKQPEILEYLKNVAVKYDLYPQIKFNHRVVSLIWDNTISKWRVVVCDRATDSQTELIYDIVVSGTGGLRLPNIPKEFESFKGPMIHSATWDHNESLDNKVVAVIGSGCSAVQIIPEIVPVVKRLLSFQRHPAWVVPKSDYVFPKLLRKVFAVIPFLQWLLRMFIFFGNELMFSAFRPKTRMSDIAKWYGQRHLQMQIPNNPDLKAKLTPNYQFGCKRVSPSNTYYKSLDSPNAEVIKSKITEAREHSIVTDDGNQYDIDVLILATGYRVQDFWAPLIVIGPDSKNILSELQKDKPMHYLGIVASVIPNLFLLLGPNTAYGHNTVVFAIECQANWIIQTIGEMRRRKAKVVCVKKSTEAEYMTNLYEKMKNTVWGTYTCGSWYANASGVITALYPGTLISYWNETRNVDFSKLDFEY